MSNASRVRSHRRDGCANKTEPDLAAFIELLEKF